MRALLLSCHIGECPSETAGHFLMRSVPTPIFHFLTGQPFSSMKSEVDHPLHLGTAVPNICELLFTE